MTTNIIDLVDKVIATEGGYVDDPTDRGGETNMGIALTQARAYGFTGDMRMLPKSTAASIYRDMYWHVPRFDAIDGINSDLAAKLFDCGVNQGPGTASMFLQRALNLLNNNGADYADIVADGRIGNLTIYALNQFYKKRGADGIKVLLRMINAQQAVRYMDLAAHTPSQEKYEYGWILNRVGDV